MPPRPMRLESSDSQARENPEGLIETCEMHKVLQQGVD
jgi:hypothetical protein